MRQNDSACDEKRISAIISSILKPLGFASKDDFQRINSIKGIGPLVSGLCSEAADMPLPQDLRLRFAELKGLFSGFDGLGEVEKKEKIRAAIGIASSIGEKKRRAFEPGPGEVERRLHALKTPLEAVKGIGPKLAERLAKKGLSTVEDILYFLPIRYEDRRSIKRIRELAPGAAQTVSAEVLACGEARYGRKKVFEMAVSDGSGILKIKWFNYKHSYMKNRFKPSERLLIYGAVSAFGQQKEMIHPDIEKLDDGEDIQQADAGIIPVYSQIENFHKKTMRKVIKTVVEGYAPAALSGAPAGALERCALMEPGEAFRRIHLPDDDIDRSGAAAKSLVFDELFLLELGLALKRRETRKESGIAFAPASREGGLEGRLKKLLPYRLTGAQEKVLGEIKKDMAAPHPMNRLIQGDVGSGKTIVSLISALNAIEAGYQAALMAPTEILSEQHYLSTRYAGELGVKSILLTGSATKAERTRALESVRDGAVDLVIGTHALIQKDVEFKKLGLIVIDEQHRFGVAQRAALRKKGFGAGEGVSPDMLIMTATPIPRTLSMTVFGDLDVSIIDELPPGRLPVQTKILREKDRLKAYSLIRAELAAGRQCYIVYPLVDESEELSLKDATNMKAHLEKDVFGDFKVGLLHGRMKSDEKEAVMRDFKARKIDILVSTTVIEVGVDVPGATVMLIEHAERFGLAQLHQLRGRVGRGDKRSVCLLMAAWTGSEDAYKRLKVMEETMDGFKIAERDLEIRGPGDFLGTRQAGLPDFRMAGALADLSILKKARHEAFGFLESDPGLTGPEAARIRAVLRARWEGRLELAQIG